MGTLRPLHRHLLPGLLLVALLTAVSYGLASLPALALVGTLVIALIVGLAWRSLAGLPESLAGGASFAARNLLRIGIVLLGVRLDFGLLLQVGPLVLLGSVAVVTLGLLGIEHLGRAAGLPRGLRLGIAVGTSICGASAILAAVPTARMKEEEAGVAVGIISVLGTVGVLGFALAASLLQPSEQLYGLVVGLTLQEVAQVLAAGYASGTEAGDLATIVKLSRVALLAPTLLTLSWLMGRREGTSPVTGLRLPVPLFLLGFLAVGALNSLGLIPLAIASVMEAASGLLMAAAMVGLGLGVDLSVFRRVGARAVLVGAAGFIGLVVATIPFAVWVARG